MKTDLRGLQNAQSLCPSYDAREPWLSDRKSPYLLLLTLLEFVSYATHLPLPQCGLDWRTGHKYDTYPEKGSCSLTVWLGSSLSIIVPTGFIMYPRPGQVNRDPGCDLLPLHDFTDEEAEARGGGSKITHEKVEGLRIGSKFLTPTAMCFDITNNRFVKIPTLLAVVTLLIHTVIKSSAFEIMSPVGTHLCLNSAVASHHRKSKTQTLCGGPHAPTDLPSPSARLKVLQPGWPSCCSENTASCFHLRTSYLLFLLHKMPFPSSSQLYPLIPFPAMYFLQEAP